MKKRAIKAVGGDMAGDTCIFPFDYGPLTYYSCVEDNIVRIRYRLFSRLLRYNILIHTLIQAWHANKKKFTVSFVILSLVIV